jgi:hypothetical protein
MLGASVFCAAGAAVRGVEDAEPAALAVAEESAVRSERGELAVCSGFDWLAGRSTCVALVIDGSAGAAEETAGGNGASAAA